MSVVHRTGTFGLDEDFYDAPEDGSSPGAAKALVPDRSQKSLTSILTGKQEHYLKHELLSKQTKFEITELSHPTALQRFGHPFRSDAGEVPPEDSELPLLRYIFVHHVRNFPFLDQAREKEFWQDKLQIFLESFAKKHISGSEDRLEETKRRKLASKAEKLVELMMVSGIPTASGYEERIRFAEMEVVDRGANEEGLVVNMPEGNVINGWDVNIAAVRTTSIKRNIRHHMHAEFLIRVKETDKPEHHVGRRYGDFVRLHRVLRAELPGRGVPPLPRKNKAHTASIFSGGNDDDSDADSVSSGSTRQSLDDGAYKPAASLSHLRSPSSAAVSLASTPRRSKSNLGERIVLYREEQRVSLRAFLRNCLQSERIAKSATMQEFLSRDPIKLNQEELADVTRRKDMDSKRMEEQRRFYEIARKRAQELDIHMEKFRRDIVESNGLTKLFKEIRVKKTIAELDPEYQKFAEWLRIEVAATIYHLFLAEDNSPELYAQFKRIHSLIPYVALKNVIRFANPALVMKGVLDLFLAQPLGARSLAQRIFSMAINDGVKSTQKYIDILADKLQQPIFCEKIKHFVESSDELKNELRQEADQEQIEVLVVILRTDRLEPELESEQIGQVFNAYVAWTNAVENIDDEMRQGAEMFAHLQQLLKLYTRQRDKKMMMSVIEEPVTLQLFRDLFTIFYEPLVRVYKSANVYSSVTDFASFADDIVRVVDAAQRHDAAADPNQTVQAFIDLCERHQDDFYKFVHEVHIHDNGLFDQLMGWLEGMLEFLRHGPKGGKLDMNALFQGAVDTGIVDRSKATAEIQALIEWQMARKTWHQDKTRRKMAAEGTPNGAGRQGAAGFKSSDFGLHEDDIAGLGLGEGDDDEDEEMENEATADEAEAADPIEAERRRRKRMQEALRSRAGEPEKPALSEVYKMMDGFLSMLRMVLAS